MQTSFFARHLSLYLMFRFKMVTANTQIKAIFMHVNYRPNSGVLGGSLHYAPHCHYQGLTLEHAGDRECC